MDQIGRAIISEIVALSMKVVDNSGFRKILPGKQKNYVLLLVVQ
jgi:hypothetical protein